ncbi:MAG: RNA-binding domain-containing protein [Bacteroidota bacterium]
MSLQQITPLLQRREGIRLEFKEARLELPGNLFETICAMLNRDGGDILLGIADDGTVTGVEPSKVATMKTNLVNQSNNAQKLEPPFILLPLVYDIQGKTVIHIQVPASSQVHKSASIVYDRSNDGDFRVTQPHRIAELFNRKRTHYTEGIIYPALLFEDFKPELFPKIRNLIRSNNPNHPWLALDDEQLLQKAGLWKRDWESGREGYTLAAALLLGKDEIIQQILPHYKIDALIRKENTARYDDRDYIDTNLIEAYERLMDFVAKHLPDKFHLEGDQRVSLRNKIFREVAANLIVHREYTNAHPTTFIIYRDRVETDNANNPHGEGPIRLDDFSPFTKNPSIAKFFIQLGRVDELGSGVLNVHRYLADYAPGKTPQFIEGNTFKMIVPLDEQMEGRDMSDTRYSRFIKEKLGNYMSDALTIRLLEISTLIKNKPGIKVKGIQENVAVSQRTLKRDLKLLTDIRVIQYQGSDRTGGYYALFN